MRRTTVALVSMSENSCMAELERRLPCVWRGPTRIGRCRWVFNPDQLRPNAFLLPKPKIYMLPTCRATTRMTGIESSRLLGLTLLAGDSSLMEVSKRQVDVRSLCGPVTCDPRRRATPCRNDTAPTGEWVRIQYDSKHAARVALGCRSCWKEHCLGQHV